MQYMYFNYASLSYLIRVMIVIYALLPLLIHIWAGLYVLCIVFSQFRLESWARVILMLQIKAREDVETGLLMIMEKLLNV